MQTVSNIAKELSEAVNALRFSEPVAYCYNPLDYAWRPAERYFERYGSGPKQALLVGMNPGPFGMAQTGVPFGDVVLVRDWLGINEQVGKPLAEHPKRPIEGFACPRREVSGKRLWGWAEEKFAKPEQFFKQFFVWNYCPLCFMEEGGKNLTPDKLPKAQNEALFNLCDRALSNVVKALDPEYVIGIGKFALKRIETALALDPSHKTKRTGSILHPSPASPIANRGWDRQAESQLRDLGVQV